MSKFVELTDYDASIHRDILDALVREDETVSSTNLLIVLIF